MEENRMLTEQEMIEAASVGAADAEAARAIDALREEMEARLRQVLDEALRLSHMNGDERANYEARLRENDLEIREREVMRRELRADALDALEARGLPKALADAVNYDNRASMTASVDAVERAFRQAVQAAVEERLRGTSPAAGASAQGDDLSQMDDETYYRLVEGAR